MMIVGLGNPGPDYQRSRHNIGFMVADELCRRWGAGSFRSKFESELCQGRGHQLLKPQTYMNLSGRAVGKALAFFQLPITEVIVIHDEIDLEFGRLKLKKGGGHGGHNGVRSIVECCGADFVRVRVGVGHPGRDRGSKGQGGGRGSNRVADYVLGNFHKTEAAELPALIGNAADAVELIVDQGLAAAMNRFNVKERRDSNGTGG